MDNGNSGRIASAKSRFNIVDIIVIVLALLLVFAFFWAFDPFGWFSSPEAQEPISLYYTVEIKGVDEELATLITVGDGVIDPKTSEVIGTVAEVTVRPAYQWKAGKGEMVKHELEGKMDVYVKVSASAIYTAGIGYGINGTQMAVGSAVTLKTASFMGKGFCIMLDENGGGLQ